MANLYAELDPDRIPGQVGITTQTFRNDISHIRRVMFQKYQPVIREYDLICAWVMVSALVHGMLWQSPLSMLEDEIYDGMMRFISPTNPPQPDQEVGPAVKPKRNKEKK
jgi:hypothetical protein